MNFPQQKSARKNKQNHENGNSPLTTGEVPNFHFDRAHFGNVYFRQCHLPSPQFLHANFNIFFVFLSKLQINQSNWKLILPSAESRFKFVGICLSPIDLLQLFGSSYSIPRISRYASFQDP